MSFLDQLLPQTIADGFEAVPHYRNTRVELPGGQVEINQHWSLPLRRFGLNFDNLKFGPGESVRAFEDLVAFWANTGASRPFRLRDWNEYRLDNELIGTGDGSETVFTLTKTYTIGSDTVVRDNILAVTAATLFGYASRTAMVITVDESPEPAYTIGTGLNAGTITFTTPPSLGAEIRATGHFDVPVVFDSDDLPCSRQEWDHGTASFNLLEYRQ